MSGGRVLPATLAVFCGGRSSRMGRDKARLDWGGEPLARSVARTLAPGFADVLISGVPALHGGFGFPCVADLCAAGPLAGLQAILLAARTPAIFAVACDMPGVRLPLVRALWEELRGRDAAVPVRGDRPEPLCAFYARRVLPAVSRALDGRARLTGWWGEATIARIPAGQLPGARGAFDDADTPAAFARLRRAHRLPEYPLQP